MIEKKQKIIQEASMVFMRNGVKSVTMDDMARHLSISKKTLYKYVKDKTDLVEQVVATIIEYDSCCMDDICGKGLNAIDEMINVAEFILKQLGNMHPSIIYDMEKYYPSAHALIKKHHHDNVYGEVLKNIQKGISEGLYRANIKAEIIAMIYSTRMGDIWRNTPLVADKYKHEEIFSEAIRYHLRGVASEKGHEYLNQQHKTNNINL